MLDDQVSEVLDTTSGRAVAVIVQAREDDARVLAAGAAAARALGQRRLGEGAADVRADLRELLLGRGRARRRGPSPSLAQALAGIEAVDERAGALGPIPPTEAAADGGAGGPGAGADVTALGGARPLLAVAPVRAALARAEERRRAAPVVPLRAARAVSVTLTRDEVAALRDHAEVGSVHANRAIPRPPFAEVRATPVAVEERKASAWGVEAIGALAAWGAYGVRGEGVTVAVLDTGVDASHPDLEGKVGAWAEFDGSGATVVGSRPHDTDRHGTHVCGTIAGGGTSGRWIGVAPAARLAVGLVLDGARGGTDAQVLAGLDWALETGAGVVSMSLGGLVLGPEVPSTYTRAFLECTLQGVPVVCAAGNDGAETTGAPGGDPMAFTVGATDVDDVVAGFSAGRTHVVTRSAVIRPELLPLVYAKPDLTAPGVAILSCIPGGGWACLSGTSMATPHVAGALALLLSGAPALATLPPAQRAAALTDALVASAAERGERGHDHRYGLGRLDVLRALGLAREPR